MRTRSLAVGCAWGVVIAAATLSGCGRTSLDDYATVGACGSPVQDTHACSVSRAPDGAPDGATSTAADGDADVTHEAATSDVAGPGSDAGGALGSTLSMASSYLVNPAHTNAVTDPTLAPPLAFLWSASFAEQTTSYPLIAGGRVYLLLGAETSGNGQLVALDERSGATLWGPVDLGGSEVVGHAYDAERIFALTGDNCLLRAFDAATGELIWSRALGSSAGSVGPPTAYRGIVYVAPNNAVIALDEVTGAILWTATVDAPGGSAPAVSDDDARRPTRSSGRPAASSGTIEHLATAAAARRRRCSEVGSTSSEKPPARSSSSTLRRAPSSDPFLPRTILSSMGAALFATCGRRWRRSTFRAVPAHGPSMAICS